MTSCLRSALLVVACAVWPTLATAATTQPDRDVLVVGTKSAPPFSYQRQDGTWTGSSIELWRELAEDLGLRYELAPTDLEGLIAGVRDGTFDAGVAALTVTAEREAILDFTHPFHTTGLAIAVPRDDTVGWFDVARAVFSRELAKLVGILALVQLLVGTAVWFVERRNNPQFPRGPAAGVGTGFWWAVVTMTTVGYGDKAPRTLAGRIVALTWMLASVVAVSTFTATIASTVTVQRLRSEVAGPGDLVRVRVGTVTASTSEAYLREEHVDFRGYDGVDDALADLAAGTLDAVVYDAPLLREFATREHGESVLVLPNTFQRQDYAIALPTGSPLRERINRILPSKLRARDEP